MKTGAIVSTAALTAVFWFAMPSHAQILGGGAAGEVTGGVTGTLSEDRLDATGQLGAETTAHGDVNGAFDGAESRVRGTLNTADEARAEAEADARAAADRARNTNVQAGASAQGSANADVDDDPSVSASGGASASGGITTDDD